MADADLHNIGTPRALGQAVGARGARYVNPYPSFSPAAERFTTGYFEGELSRENPIPIIAPEPPTEDGPKIA